MGVCACVLRLQILLFCVVLVSLCGMGVSWTRAHHWRARLQKATWAAPARGRCGMAPDPGARAARGRTGPWTGLHDTASPGIEEYRRSRSSVDEKAHSAA